MALTCRVWSGVGWTASGADAVGMTGRPRPLPPALPLPVFTTAEALAAGVSASRLRAADIRSLDRGLWALGERPITEADIVAALCRRDRDAFAAGLTAARLWGVPLPGVLADEVVSAPATSRRDHGRSVHRPRGRTVDIRIHLASPAAPRRGTALVRWSRLEATPVSLEKGPTVRVTSRIRTLLDLSGVLRHEALVAIGDHLVRHPRQEFERRSKPYASLEELLEAAGAFHGRGARRLRAAVTQMRLGSDSPAETRLRLALVKAGLPEPLANERPVGGVDRLGTEIDLGQPDLHWPRWRVAVEHDRPTHLTPEQQAKDIARGERRSRAGWVEVRTMAEDLQYGCRKAVNRVRDALLRQGWTPSA